MTKPSNLAGVPGSVSRGTQAVSCDFFYLKIRSSAAQGRSMAKSRPQINPTRGPRYGDPDGAHSSRCAGLAHPHRRRAEPVIERRPPRDAAPWSCDPRTGETRPSRAARSRSPSAVPWTAADFDLLRRTDQQILLCNYLRRRRRSGQGLAVDQVMGHCIILFLRVPCPVDTDPLCWRCGASPFWDLTFSADPSFGTPLTAARSVGHKIGDAHPGIPVQSDQLSGGQQAVIDA